MRDPVAWLLLVLLVGSNAAWFLTEPDDEPARAPRVVTPPEPEPEPETVRPPVETSTASRKPRRQESERLEPVWNQVESWRQDLLQLERPDRRDAALEEIRAVLRDSDDPLRIEAALRSFCLAWSLRFDRDAFRDCIVMHLGSPHARVREQTLFAFGLLPREPGDLELVLPLVNDPVREVRVKTIAPIVTIGERTLDERAGAAAVQLLSKQDQIRDVLPHLNNLHAPPALQARMLELARDPEWRARIFHFCLGSIQNPSAEIIDELIKGLLGDDYRVRESARHWLRPRSHDDPHLDRRLDGYIELLKKQDRWHAQRETLVTLGNFGRVRHANAIAALLAADHFGEEHREEVAKTIELIREREARH